jgi:hypothetical protein
MVGEQGMGMHTETAVQDGERPAAGRAWVRWEPRHTDRRTERGTGRPRARTWAARQEQSPHTAGAN